MLANTEIRVAVACSGVKLWHIAEAMGVSDSSLSRKLRRELSDDEKQKILGIINQLKREDY